jgi:Protein of unknown function (DUF3300)
MIRIRSLTLMGLLAMAPAAGFAQEAPPPPANDGATAVQSADAGYTTAQLDQMLAPIALYPDTLLANILMASTFPVEIIEAERWLSKRSHAALRGDALVAALQPLPWDPSVKSLVPFPAILKQLDEQLDWTQSLGNAFANQQAAVMAEVQVLRRQCEASGKLTTTPQLRVRHEESAVIIEPANPAVVYVPVYNPVEVFGGWPYPAYPPFYFPPYPGFFVGSVGIGIGFSVGFGVVGPLWGWGYPSWSGGGIFIDSGRYSRISYNHVGYAGGTFHHQGAIGRVGGTGFSRSASAGGGLSRSGTAVGTAGRRSGSLGRTASTRAGTVGGTGRSAGARSATATSSRTSRGAGSNRGAQSHGLARANQVAGSHGQAGRANAASRQAASHGGGGGGGRSSGGGHSGNARGSSRGGGGHGNGGNPKH